jgi:hypothetical protein
MIVYINFSTVEDEFFRVFFNFTIPFARQRGVFKWEDDIGMGILKFSAETPAYQILISRGEKRYLFYFRFIDLIE